jgi:hypothetical protein
VYSTAHNGAVSKKKSLEEDLKPKLNNNCKKKSLEEELKSLDGRIYKKKSLQLTW